jgi:hypothetical protein
MSATVEMEPKKVEISSSILMSDDERVEYERAQNAKIAREEAATYKRRGKIGRDLSLATREIIPPQTITELDPTDEFDDFAPLRLRTPDEDMAWQDRAVCIEADPEVFFPDKERPSTREAKRLCLGCEVVDKCLEYALENNEKFGIWGGKTERERQRMKQN